jgi:opacity protein-like surface antigen
MRWILMTCCAIGVALSATNAMAQRALKPSPLYQTGWFEGPAQPYLRLGIGAASPDFDDANWAPPGFDRPQNPDPRVFFDLSEPGGAAGTIAIGRNLKRHVRGELALTYFDSRDISGPWSFTRPATPGPHASMSTDIQSTALMANIFYDFSPLGQGAFAFRPYVMAGLGMSWNDMGDWTRKNSANANRPVRTFEGDTDSEFAWSLGVGAAWTVGQNSAGPIKLDLMYQYFDLGSVSGKTRPLPGNGNGSPVEGLNFDIKSQVITLGVRIPLNLR